MNEFERWIETVAVMLLRAYPHATDELVGLALKAGADALLDLLDRLALAAPVHDPETMH
ncbi:hypothetical protein [Enterovirga aerilata]|uniref:Uncharacterized protein n=1 Tax=Enterovirga aerilata TaxID=2730920 RepID=A0A849HY07_9HYPH|nr:hypothetical protein [Enterovirga sp. DB1703]NNM72416.1 hypothetical protein [Enterovirga sp. DB1703]